MDNLKGTQSEKNVLAAFAGESQARNRYTFFAEQAKAEGNEETVLLFERMARNEMTHAKLWFRMYHDGLGGSSANLQEAASGENTEWRSMYPGFAEQARADGLEQLALLFEKVAEVERDHERTFLNAYMELLKKGDAAASEASKPEPAAQRPVYRCAFCGAVYDERPDVCSVCGAIGSFEAGTAAVK